MIQATETLNAQEIVKATPPLSEVLDLFLRSQDVKPASRNLYSRTLRLFFSWVEKKGFPLRDLTRAEIVLYKEDLLSSGLSTLTVSSYLTAVRKFYEWAEANRISPNIARGIKTPKRNTEFKKDPLTVEQIKALLESMNRSTLTGKRDYAMLNLLIRTGLRTIELVRANVEDIQHRSGEEILLVQGKGRDAKDNFVILTKKSSEPIYEYLRERGRAKVNEPLFCSESNNSKGQRLTTRTVSHVAKQNLRGIGLNSGRITAHSFRHTAGVNILRAGGDLYTTQLFMRHSNPATTQIYLRSIETETRIKNAPEKLLDRIF